jgi:hypothetical protein
MQPDPAYTLLFLLLIVAAAALIISMFKLPPEKLSQFGQGWLGIASTLALATGVWLFVTERRDKPKIDLGVGYTALALSPDTSPSGRALVQFVASIENRGSHLMTFDCAALDVHGIPAAGVLPRNPEFQNDFDLKPLLQATATGKEWEICRPIERGRWLKKNPDRDPAGYVAPTTGFRYRRFKLEPGEKKTRHFELAVPCDYAAVRFTFNVPKPRTSDVYEIKEIVPLASACKESREIAEVPAPAETATRSEPRNVKAARRGRA